jgi:hypothetical protein
VTTAHATLAACRGPGSALCRAADPLNGYYDLAFDRSTPYLGAGVGLAYNQTGGVSFIGIFDNLGFPIPGCASTSSPPTTSRWVCGLHSAAARAAAPR